MTQTPQPSAVGADGNEVGDWDALSEDEMLALLHHQLKTAKLAFITPMDANGCRTWTTGYGQTVLIPPRPVLDTRPPGPPPPRRTPTAPPDDDEPPF